MAIDYIIGALQLLSAAVNVLALAAFWVTPGLRTTANRFVINLLVVNIVGCLALTPALFLHGGLKPEAQRQMLSMTSDDEWSEPLPTSPLPPLDLGAGQDPQSIQENIETECVESEGARRCDTVIIEKNKHSTKILEKSDFQDDNGEVEVIDELYEDVDGIESVAALASEQFPTKNVIYSDCTRFWGFDLVAALGECRFSCDFLSSISLGRKVNKSSETSRDSSAKGRAYQPIRSNSHKKIKSRERKINTKRKIG